VIDLGPHNTTAYIYPGIAYAEKGDDDRALADCNKAMEIDPRFALTYKILGNAYHDVSMSAMYDFSRAIACKKDGNVD
jgi:Tfp pilus assembly protein PilF